MMDQMAFVTAAYAVTAVLGLGTTLWAWRSMRAAEQRVDNQRKDR